MNIKRNIIVDGKHGKPLLVDVYVPKSADPAPVVLFAHGFKGFKDWGIWDLIAREFVRAGYVFLKFNFSHNGTTISAPLDFGDLPAFGENNYTKELADIDLLLDHLEKGTLVSLDKVDLNKLTIIGHSRGGGITAVKAGIDPRITAWIGWASVKDLAYAWRGKEELIEKWKETGVLEIMNGRTKQLMPLYFQLYEDFSIHEEAYSVEVAISCMEKPLLVIHGTNDPAVPVGVTDSFKSWNERLELTLIEGANHVFGGSHPFEETVLPAHAQRLVERSLTFLSKL